MIGVCLLDTSQHLGNVADTTRKSELIRGKLMQID